MRRHFDASHLPHLSMHRSWNAVLLVLIFLLPGCLNAMNEEPIKETESIIEVFYPPIPVISVSPSEPLTEEEVFVNVELFNYIVSKIIFC